MKNVRNIALWIIAAELLCAGFFVTALFVPLPGKIEFKIVQSGSMEPAIPVGAVVAIVPAATYSVGDVITFGYDTQKRIPTTHRIVGTERKDGVLYYQTKGDANEEADNKAIPHSSVIGTVALTVPRLGFVLDYARGRDGFFFMIVIPALLIILDEVLTIVAALRGRRAQGLQKTQPNRDIPPVVVPRTSLANSSTVIPVRAARTMRRTYNDVRAGIDGCRVVVLHSV